MWKKGAKKVKVFYYKRVIENRCTTTSLSNHITNSDTDHLNDLDGAPDQVLYRVFANLFDCGNLLYT
jgi:hypothetical protein